MQSIYYVVKRGRNPGIYRSWSECEAQVKKYSNAKFKKFTSFELAQDYWLSEDKLQDSLPTKGLAVDASLLKENSRGEFQIVDLETKEVIYSSPVYINTTVNVMEFLAITKAIELSFVNEKFLNCDIYSDSATAITWTKNKHINSKTPLTSELTEIVQQALETLNQSYTNQIIKWDTNVFGEIPADFNRK